MLLLATVVLIGAAWLRGAEYDEQYTLFLTAGTARPDWPETVFPAGAITAAQSGHASMAGIARDLRNTDVHPPLYFWTVWLWRAVFGPGLFAARMLSVLCGLISLGLVGVIAARCRISPVVSMLVTLGCYGFVYTNVVARGFAAAEMLTLCGVVLLVPRRIGREPGRQPWPAAPHRGWTGGPAPGGWFDRPRRSRNDTIARDCLAGVCLGAACCCNYLAVFVAAAAILAVGDWRAVLAAAPFLALDAWFFAAQHGARPNQFPPFALWRSLARLGEYQVASVFGGLPLYFDGLVRIVVGTAVGLLAVWLALRVAAVRPWGGDVATRVVVSASIAPPVGLLLLGAVFDNTPIELRYLSFGLPFIALLVALAAASRRRRVFLPLLLAVQAASICGLVFSPRTMQPARNAAIDAARLVGDGVVVVPRGNDGVGIVGAFAIEAPPALPILLVRPTDPIADRIAPYHRVTVAKLAQDRDSTATIARLRAALRPPNWRLVANGSNVAVYQRTGTGE